jgi:starch synthase
LRYGAVPIVARVGGLEDTIADANEPGARATGFKFGPVTAEDLAAALRRASITFHDKPAWQSLQRHGMTTDVSWHNRASHYADLYRDMLARGIAARRHGTP